MQSTNIPAKFQIPWGNSAGGSFIRTIPVPSQIGIQSGAASLTDGFPPLNFLPVGSGGIPPFGQDMNGILQQITAWGQWQAAGAPIYYDATFSTSIGGYPKGTVLSATSAIGNFWISTVENNASNPDTGGANWVGYTLATLTQLHYGADTGSVNSIVANVNPPILSYLAGNAYIVTGIAATNTGAMSANFNSVGARSIVLMDGSPVPANVVSGGALTSLFLIDTGTKLAIANVSQATLPVTSMVTFLTSQTWNVPSNVSKVKRVQLWGAGGGGGGSSNTNFAGTGGGGGGYAEGVNIAVTPGGTVTVTVGAAGLAGTATPTNGASGGTTSFGGFVVATGGGGGGGSTGPGNVGAIGSPGTGTVGALLLTAQNGGTPTIFSATVAGSGQGGGSPFGGGNQGVGQGNSVPAGVGIFPGGGGNGGSAVQAGGAGSTGFCIIQY